MNKIKEIAIVVSHANTEEKIEILNQCIDSLKRQNYPVIVSSHIAVPNEIFEKVDYVVYDSKNEMITSSDLRKEARTFEFIQRPGFYLENDYDNHAFAVLKLMTNAASLAKINGYDICHMIHYDCIIEDNNLLKKHYNSLVENDIHYYYYDIFTNRIDANVFSVRLDRFIEVFGGIKYKEDYINQEIGMFESFLFYLSQDYKLKCVSEEIKELKKNNKIDLVKSFEFGIKRKYDNEVETTTSLYLAEDINNLIYIVIFTNDTNIKSVEFTVNNIHYSKEINNVINIFRVDKSSLRNIIKCYLPYFEHTEYFDEKKQMAKCHIIDYNLINFSSLIN